MAKGKEVEIVLLNVQPTYHTPNVRRFVSQHQIHEIQEEMGHAALEEVLAAITTSSIPVSTKIRTGATGAEIIAEAKEMGAAAIVMGFRGMGAIKGTVLGSVSYSVLHDAPCPVTIVP
jgi:nucleotide-binding universal stress UspA family protein